MGKKRERGVTRRVRVEPGNDPNRSRKPAGLVIFFIVSTSIALAVYFVRFDSNKDTSSTISDQPPNTRLNYLDILSGNSKVSKNESHRHFTNPVLAYVTPWNSKGYDMAKKFNSKFTHISPVWYDLKSQDSDVVLEGRHNADRGWISELRKAGNAKILPRVVLEVLPAQLLRKKKQRRKAIDILVAELKEMEYDGFVLESWSRWAAYGVLYDSELRKMALDFIKQLGQALHGVSLEGKDPQYLELIFVIGPPHGSKLQPYDFGPEDIKILGDDVDGYSLMTYDFSSPPKPGPNAPLKWVRSTLKILLNTTNNNDSQSPVNKKIFVGINFYGNDFALSEERSGGAITGREYLSLLKQHQPSLQWDDDSGEHYFIYSDNNNIKHVVFYPSLMSISLRLDESRSWGAGISIWELGQGLHYFFNLL